MNNPIQYTSRDFQSILNDINSDDELAIKPNWWKRLWAGIGDVLSTWLNAIVNNLYLRTAFTRNAVMDLCALIDYDLSPQSTSSGKCLFFARTDLGTGIFPFTVSKDDLKARSTGGLTSSSKIFEARADETFILVSDTFTSTPASDILTVSTDFEYTGHKLRFTTTGTLPAPLQIDTDYYAVYVNATTIRLAESLDDAFANNYIDITDAGTGTHTLNVFSKVVDMYQQDSVAENVVIGTSNGTTEWQEFILPDELILKDTLIITINSVNWTKVDTLVNSISTDTHYKVIPKANNQMAIRFGNGIYGAIPGAFDIIATYSIGGGILSNVSSYNKIISYSGGDSNISDVSNPTTFTGGTDAESINNAKILAPLLLKSRDRFVTAIDGETLALKYGGLSLVKVLKNFYGVLSCKVVGIANGGGNPSSSLRNDIQQYLIDRTILESIDVRFEASTITAINVISATKIKSGYSYTNVEPFFRLAYRLFLTETGTEIQNIYNSTGIADSVSLINSIFGTSFGTADYNQIKKLIENLTPRNFGDSIEESDVYAYVGAFVDGIDYMTITTFNGGFPVALATDEITTVGTLTLTEIP